MSILVQGDLKISWDMSKDTLESGLGLLRMRSTDSTKTLDEQIQALITFMHEHDLLIYLTQLVLGGQNGQDKV